MIKKYGKKYSAEVIKPMGRLYLGVSMGVSIAIGVFIGVLLERYTGIKGLFFVGLALGIASAILNVVREFKALNRSFKELEEEYKDKKITNDYDDED